MIAKVEFPIGKKLFHLVVNPGTWPGARPWTWNWYKLQETSMEHDIPFGNSNRENGTTFLDFPLFLGIFQWDEPTKRVPFTAEPEIPEILTKRKAPDNFCYLKCTFPFWLTGIAPRPKRINRRSKNSRKRGA